LYEFEHESVLPTEFEPIEPLFPGGRYEEAEGQRFVVKWNAALEENMHPLARCLIAAACAFAFAPLAWAQAWPVKLIRLITGSPKEYAALLRRDRERFGAIIREANMRAD